MGCIVNMNVNGIHKYMLAKCSLQKYNRLCLFKYCELLITVKGYSDFPLDSLHKA